MLTDAIDVMRYIKASAGRSALRVEFSPGTCPRHDGSTITLPSITKDTTSEQLTELMASVDHEVAHDQYSDFDILKEKNISCATSPLGFLWNVIEDSRVNALEANEYEGFRELWDQSTPNLLAKINTKTEGNTPLDEITRSLIKWETGVSSKIFPMCEISGKAYETNPKIDSILSTFDERLINCQEEVRKKEGSAMTYDLARDIFRALGGDPDAEEKRAKEEKKEGGTTKKPGKEGKEGEKCEVKLAKPGEGEKGEAGEKEEDEDWCILKIEMSDVEDRLLTLHEGKVMSKVGLLYDVPMDEKDKWALAPLEDFINVDYANNSITGVGAPSWLSQVLIPEPTFKRSFNERVAGKAITSENFAQQVRRLIQIKSRSRYEYGVKKGRLDYSRLNRLVMKAPGFSERVFKNKITNNILDASVSILVDMSGSMSGDKMLYATEATLLLNNVFQVLGVPLEINGFTDHGKWPINYSFKTFNKIKLSNEDLLDHISGASQSMSGNPDGDNILFVHNRLIKRKEKKKVLIVMSDGQPASSRMLGGEGPFTKKVIEDIEKQKRVDIYGLGLCNPAVQRYYKHHSVVNNPAEIPLRLLELIEHV